MAFGFTPRYEQTFELNDTQPEQFLAIALEVAKQLDWEVSYISRSGFIAYTGHSVFSKNSEVKLLIDEHNATVTSKSLGSEMADLGRNKRITTNFTDRFDEVKAAMQADELQEKVTELQPVINNTDEDILTLPQPTTAENVKGILSLFMPKGNYFITPIIIDLNILLFVLMVVISHTSVFLPDTDTLITWGADVRTLTLGGQWWRLLTNVFLHIGIIHLLFNMYALSYIGLLLEHHLGKLRYATAYLFTGILGSLASVAWHPYTISAGASGAIFGMYGVFLALLTSHYIDKSVRKAFLTSILIFGAFNLANGLKQGIDNAAHLGGLVSGFLIGYLYIASLKKPDNISLKYTTVGIVAGFAVAISAILYYSIPNNLGAYEAKMKDFSIRESMALEVFSLPANTPREQLMDEIKSRGLYYWDEDLQLVKEADQLDLPEEIHARNKKLIAYCQLRIESYQLLYKAVAENTDKYKPQITDYNNRIQQMLDNFKK